MHRVGALPDVSDAEFDRFIAGCEGDAEKSLVDTDEMFRTHQVPPKRVRSWEKLPVKEQQIAKRICQAFLEGERWTLGHTHLELKPVKK